MPLSETMSASPSITREQRFGGRDIGLEGMQVAVVDPDQFRIDLSRERELVRVMDLNQRRHPQLARERSKRAQFAFLQHRGDQQDTIGAGRARLDKVGTDRK